MGIERRIKELEGAIKPKRITWVDIARRASGEYDGEYDGGDEEFAPLSGNLDIDRAEIARSAAEG